jgi:hypothetical protein
VQDIAQRQQQVNMTVYGIWLRTPRPRRVRIDEYMNGDESFHARMWHGADGYYYVDSY